jgi:hypothetical protein
MNYSTWEIREIIKQQKEKLNWTRYMDMSGIEGRLFILFEIIEDILEKLDCPKGEK